MAEDNRIKIRQLPESDVSGSDTIAIAKNNIEKTVQASLTDAVRAGLTIEAGPGITVTQTQTGVKITGTAEYDDTSTQAKLADLQSQLDALKNVENSGASVKAQQKPPKSSSEGDLWWDTNTANMYIKYNGAWVQTNGGAGGASADIADTGAPGVVAPNDSFRVSHTGNMTLNSYVTIPTLDTSDANGDLNRKRWKPNTSYFKGEHFRGPDIDGNDATYTTSQIRNIVYKASKSYTSSSNFINDMNAKTNFYPASNSGKGQEGGQLAVKSPDQQDLCVDAYKDVNNWYGRGSRTYLRLHDNRGDGYQILLDPFKDGGAWLFDGSTHVFGDSSTLIPWGGNANKYAYDGHVYAFDGPAQTQEGSVVIDYPGEWTGGKPDHVLVSTKYPGNDALSQSWFQVVEFDKKSVTLFTQSQHSSNIKEVIPTIVLMKNSSGAGSVSETNVNELLTRVNSLENITDTPVLVARGTITWTGRQQLNFSGNVSELGADNELKAVYGDYKWQAGDKIVYTYSTPYTSTSHYKVSSGLMSYTYYWSLASVNVDQATGQYEATVKMYRTGSTDYVHDYGDTAWKTNKTYNLHIEVFR